MNSSRGKECSAFILLLNLQTKQKIQGIKKINDPHSDEKKLNLIIKK